jgi:hypothetical protein
LGEALLDPPGYLGGIKAQRVSGAKLTTPWTPVSLQVIPCYLLEATVLRADQRDLTVCVTPTLLGKRVVVTVAVQGMGPTEELFER